MPSFPLARFRTQPSPFPFRFPSVSGSPFRSRSRGKAVPCEDATERGVPNRRGFLPPAVPPPRDPTNPLVRPPRPSLPPSRGWPSLPSSRSVHRHPSSLSPSVSPPPSSLGSLPSSLPLPLGNGRRGTGKEGGTDGGRIPSPRPSWSSLVRSHRPTSRVLARRGEERKGTGSRSGNDTAKDPRGNARESQRDEEEEVVLVRACSSLGTARDRDLDLTLCSRRTDPRPPPGKRKRRTWGRIVSSHRIHGKETGLSIVGFVSCAFGSFGIVRSFASYRTMRTRAHVGLAHVPTGFGKLGHEGVEFRFQVTQGG